jgi:hypothetical protein
MRLRLTPEGCLISLLAGSTVVVLVAVLLPGRVNGTRLLMAWAGPTFVVALVGAWYAGRRGRS